MSVHQWFVIALNISAFIGMVTMFVVYGSKETRGGTVSEDSETVDYRQYRKI